MKENKKHSAFTLIESIFALAIFAMAAFSISQICYNYMYALDVSEKKSQDDSVKDLLFASVMNVTEYDALDDGQEVENIDGQTYRVYGYAEPTEIMDLFSLEIVAEGNGITFKQKVFVIRPDWYQDINFRQQLVRDRTDFLEDKRREWRSPTE